MQEVWRDAYKGYQVSDLGRVRSLKKKEVKILTARKDKKGYLQVHLRIDGKDKIKRVHRLVAETFIPNPENKPQINHEDGNKENNCVSNLTWVTNGENQLHAYKNGLRKKMKGKDNCNAIKVLQFDLNNQFIKEWDCIKDASRELNIIDCGISFCCKGKRKTAGGYIWKYKDIS
jgi:hypothetical protein